MDELKSNRKTVRLTDKVYRYIEGYRGDNFNERLENLVLDHEERAEELRRDWQLLEAAIGDKRQELRQVQDRLRRVRNVDVRFGPLVEALQQLLNG